MLTANSDTYLRRGQAALGPSTANPRFLAPDCTSHTITLSATPLSLRETGIGLKVTR